jgi:hypothetical protein
VGEDDHVPLVPGGLRVVAAAGDDAQFGAGRGAVHLLVREVVGGVHLDGVDGEERGAAVAACHLDGAALLEGAEVVEDGGAVGVVDVARDDGGAPLAGGGAGLVPAREVLLPGGRDVQAALRGEAEAHQRGVHADGGDADALGRGVAERGGTLREGVAGAGLGGGGLGRWVDLRAVVQQPGP